MTETLKMMEIINKNKEINAKRKKDAGTSSSKKFETSLENIKFSMCIGSFIAFFDILSKWLVK